MTVHVSDDAHPKRNAGPHHEAPETVNALVSEWIEEMEGQGQQGQGGSSDGGNSRRRQTEQVRVFRESITGREVRAVEQDGKPRDLVEWLVAATILR